MPSPLEVSAEERLILTPPIAGGGLPLRIGALDATLRSDEDLRRFLAQPRWAARREGAVALGAPGGKGSD